MGLFDKKYNWEKHKHCTLFYGNIDTATAIVCHFNRAITYANIKFNWLVIGIIPGMTHADYCKNWNNVCDVVTNIVNRRALTVVLYTKCYGDKFWYLPRNATSEFDSNQINAKLSSRKVITRDKLFNSLKLRIPPYYRLDGFKLCPPDEKLSRTGEDISFEEAWFDQFK